MKKTKDCILFIAVYLLLTIFLYGCISTSSTNELNEVVMKDYYTAEDFQSIIIGESTFRDVYKVAPTESIQMTSYGGLCNYPMQSGGYVCIKFYGKNLIVGAIETVSKTDDSSGGQGDGSVVPNP